MTIQIKLFAVAMQKAGTSELEVDCPLPATLADLEQAILTTCPTLADILPHCRFAVDDQFATCLLYTSPSPRDGLLSRMPSSA